ncbi:MAG: NYN domain-containing protein [Pirellulaceae bacterium]
MALLIDGYNLLYASDIFPRADEPATLERSRLALLDFLADVLPPKLAARTIVAFDAIHAPPGLPREHSHRGVGVRFAERGHTADELLEELILAEPDPRHLLVVSSDHRIQRAARQQGANFTDSEPWYAEQLRLWREALDPRATAEEKDVPPMANPFPPGYGEDLLGK